MFSLVVGADGAQSAVRRLSGIPMWGWGYGQEAVVATVKVKTDPRHWDAANRTAWQRYLPTGPLALLPLWGDLCSIVWSLPMLEARRVRALSEAAFLQELNLALAGDLEVEGTNRSQASSASFSSPSISESISDLIAAARDRSVGGLLGAGTQLLAKPVGFLANEVNALVSTATSAALISNPPRPPHEVVGIESARFSFPLQLQQAHRYFTPRVALVGDSAHSIHPQAGQGLNMGLQDANDLATVLAEAINSGADFGLPGTLQKYSDLAKPRNLKMLGVVDTVHRLFGAGGDSILMRDDSPALGELPKTLRSLGMLGIHSSAPLRQRLAKYAMGLTK
jgi:ubiquinone biosynthesis monooxygenase Coq6